MDLFGRKKKDKDAPYLPQSPDDLPPLPPMLKKPSLKEQLDSGDLPPLPPMPRGGLPPMPKEELPPLPKERPLPPLKRHAPPRLPKLPEMPGEEVVAPSKPTHVFVRLDKYNSILKAISGMESKINELRSTISKINSIKAKEDEIISGWTDILQEAKTKIEGVSKKLPDVERA